MKAIKVFVGTLALLVIGLLVSGHGYILSGMTETYFRGWKNANIDDIEFRDLRTIAAAEDASPWIYKPIWNADFTPEDAAWHEEYQSAAFLVVQADTLRFERYWRGFDEHTVSNSFSACKSIVAMAVGLAAKEGLVDVEEEIGAYIPRLAGDAGKGLTVEEALQMRTHIPFGEDYDNPFGFMAKAYYRDNMQDLLEAYAVPAEHGSEWMYQGGNTMLLGELVANLGRGTLSDWVEHGLWQPMGAQDDAFWGLDAPDEEGGIERCFAMYYATARDFARFGKLLNHAGNWNGTQLLDSGYVAAMVQPIAERTNECDADHYGYQIWLGETEDGLAFSCMEGLRGQFIVAIPALDLVVVRTGFDKDKRKTDELPSCVYRMIDMGRGLLAQE
jgi:CubicO group peptidase (beta-lactamase class C family)